MLFRSVFLKTQNKLLTANNGKNGVFDGQQLFFVSFQIYQQQKNCMSNLFKAESEPKHKEQFFWGGFSSKTKKPFFGGPKSSS